MAVFLVESLTTGGVVPLSFALERGQALVLRGASGVGKTRVLRALADLDPHSGDVWLNGQAQAQIDAPDWRRQVCLVPAESAWWEDTPAEHFESWPPTALQQLGLTRAIEETGTALLSSGERTRLALLRAWSVSPRVLLLDEPSANLDAINRRRLTDLLNVWCREHGLIVVCASHDAALHVGLEAFELEVQAQ